jgi:hypothetical protein
VFWPAGWRHALVMVRTAASSAASDSLSVPCRMTSLLARPSVSACLARWPRPLRNSRGGCEKHVGVERPRNSSAAAMGAKYQQVGVLDHGVCCRCACPHDCPDTCALQSHGAGRPACGAGRPRRTRPPAARCAPRCRATRAHLPPRAGADAAAPRGPKGSGRFEPGGWDEALDRHRRAAGRHRRARPRRPSCPTATPAPWAWCRARAWPARFFHRLGASLLDRTICATAGGEALVPPTAARSACTWSSSPRPS